MPTLDPARRKAARPQPPFTSNRVFQVRLTGVTPERLCPRRGGRDRVREEPRAQATRSPKQSTVPASIPTGRFLCRNRSDLLGMTPDGVSAPAAPAAQIRFAVGECSFGSILVGRDGTKGACCVILLGDDPPRIAARSCRTASPRAQLVGGGTAAFETPGPRARRSVSVSSKAPRPGPSTCPWTFRGTALFPAAGGGRALRGQSRARHGRGELLPTSRRLHLASRKPYAAVAHKRCRRQSQYRRRDFPCHSRGWRNRRAPSSGLSLGCSSATNASCWPRRGRDDPPPPPASKTAIFCRQHPELVAHRRRSRHLRLRDYPPGWVTARTTAQSSPRAIRLTIASLSRSKGRHGPARFSARGRVQITSPYPAAKPPDPGIAHRAVPAIGRDRQSLERGR